jgi:hypothetical protein
MWEVFVRGIVGTAAAIALLLPAGVCGEQTVTLGWPQVIDTLTKERTQAEACVGLLKSRGDKATVESAEAKYEMARADMDGVIAGLTTALVEGGKPDSLPTVRTTLETSGQTLQTICDAAVKTATPDTKGLWDEIAKAAIEPLIKPISDGIAGLWARHIQMQDRERDAKKAQLEAARWPEFGDITAR